MVAVGDPDPHPAQDQPVAEMGNKYTRSRWVSYCLVIATCGTAGYLILRGDATSAEVDILKTISGLAMAATATWMGVSNGRQAYVEGKKKSRG